VKRRNSFSFLILNEVKVLIIGEEDSSPSQTLRRPFADPSLKLRASAQGFGSGLRLRVRMKKIIRMI
jgi:hypothetical protein